MRNIIHYLLSFKYLEWKHEIKGNGAADSEESLIIHHDKSDQVNNLTTLVNGIARTTISMPEDNCAV